MLQSISIRSRRGAGGDAASELSQLTSPDHANDGSELDVVVTEKDIRIINAYLQNGKVHNRKCRMLLQMIAEEIENEKDDQDCLNQQIHHYLIAEEVADQNEVLEQAKNGDGSIAQGRSALASYARQMGSDEQWRKRLFRRNIRYVKGIGWVEDEHVDPWRARKRARTEILDSLRTSLVGRFDAEAEAEAAEEALQREQERIFAEEYGYVDEYVSPHAIAGGIAQEKEEQDCLNQQIYYNMIAEEMAERDEVMAEEEEREELIADEAARQDEGLQYHFIHDELVAEEIAEQEDALSEEERARRDRLLRQENEELIAEEIAQQEEALHYNLLDQAHDELIKEEIAEQDEVLAEAENGEEARQRHREELIAEDGCCTDWYLYLFEYEYAVVRFLEQAQDELVAEEEHKFLWQAHDELVAGEIAEEEEALALAEKRQEGRQRHREELIAEYYLDTDLYLAQQELYLWQARDELVAEEELKFLWQAHDDLVAGEIADEEEALSEAEKGEEACWRHREELIAEDYLDTMTKAHDDNERASYEGPSKEDLKLLDQAHEELVAEEIAEQDEVLAEQTHRDWPPPQNGEWNNAEEGGASAKYSQRIGLYARARGPLARAQTKTKYGHDLLGVCCWAYEENVVLGRPRKRARKEILHSLRMRLTRRFETEAEAAEEAR